MTTTLTADQAAHGIIDLLNTSVLADADAVLDDGGVGAWLSKALPQRERLSSGEKVLLNVVLFVYNGGGNATLNDLTVLDRATLAQVLTVIQHRFGGV